jgi:hypothetical protein
MSDESLDELYEQARDEAPFSNSCECGCGSRTNPGRRYVIGHNARSRGVGTFEQRFWSKVRKDEACWAWTGATHSNGYGQLRGPDGRVIKAHRAAYELLVGPIPAGMQLDHVCHSTDPACSGGSACRHRRCVNPAHLEPVTHQENGRRSVIARRTHCPQGHPYSDENTYRWKGARNCRACAAQTGPARYQAWRDRQKGGASDANAR